MIDPKDYHKNAASLIVAAALKSGLLDDVATALWFAYRRPQLRTATLGSPMSLAGDMALVKLRKNQRNKF